MSDIKINNITDRTGDSGPIFAGISTVSTSAFMVMPSGPTEYRGGRGRGIFAGSYTPSSPNLSSSMDFVEISTLGNAVDFGDVSAARSGNPGLSGRTRAIIGAGYGPSNQIMIVTMASQGDATDFGNDVGNSNRATGVSNGTRGIFAGSSELSPGNVIRYITIDSLGDALDFGDLFQGSRSGLGGAASTTRGVFALSLIHI